MHSTIQESKGLPRRRWVGLAIALAVLAGALLTGTSATAATPRGASVAQAQAQQDFGILAVCRKVDTFQVPVYTSASGSSIYGYWFYGTIFTDFGQVSPYGRHLNWWPAGVPPQQGVPAYVQHAGTIAVSCPW